MEKTKVINKEIAEEIIKSLRRIEEEISTTLESIEILSDPETLESIKRGIEDIRQGKIKSFNEFLKEHGV